MNHHGTAYGDSSLPLDDELVALIHEGPLEAQPWLRLLKSLRARLRCSHANIAFHRRPAPGAWFDAVVDSEHSAPISTRTYLAKYAAIDPIPYQRLVPGRPYLKKELYDADGIFQREFLHPQGIDDLVILLIEESAGMRAWLTLARDATQPPFSAADCHVLRALTPHFTTALRTFCVLKSAELERDIYRKALEDIAFGTLLIDQTGRVVRADTAATRLLERNSGLVIIDGRLRTACRKEDLELREAITAAIRDSSLESPTFSRAMRLSACTHLTLLVRSLAPSATSANQQAAAAIVYLSDTQAASTASVQQLVDLFDLSAMEAALALQLVRGRTLAEAARILHLSQHTARTYSKHIFAKTGAHRQADLVRLILTSVARLAA
jgi:DNA-binding CsgD family transcriptional regulator/PAS domain-containing protein